MTRLTLAFFGAFQVTFAQQPITRFRSANNQGLLVYLALHNNKPLPREVLATLFWPEESEQNARNNLRQSLYQLRKLLGDSDGPDQPYLLVTRQTAQFNSESDYLLDVNLFLQTIEAGDLEAAVAHYHGELLPGFTCDSLQFEDWLRQEREQLHHLALEAMSEVTQDHLQTGRLDQAQAMARRQLSLEPWRELAHRQLMQAFALAGDRGNALSQFEVCREQLWQELSIEPAPETVALFEDIQTGRYGPIATVETLRPPVKVRHNLPADTTPFIGRELELSQVGSLLTQDKQRLVTIIGSGGMGKTRLALAAGSSLLEEYRDGVYFVDLAPLSHPEEISLTIAAALDYQAPDKTQDLWPQLLNSLSQRQLLLILDNFEHLLAGTTLVNEILLNCPDLALVVTSRQRLNLASENRYELGGLEFPDLVKFEEALTYTAVQLFVESGRRAHSDFTLTENNLADVLRICQLVQGMPLGLVLAAAWLELLTPAEIETEIESSLDFLAADLVDLPARQRSLQAVFERSWEMMTPAERTALANLSIFRGGFTRQAAEQVASTNLRLLLSLVNKSLLQRQSQSGRFTMHELLRQYATQKRLQVDPADPVSLTHCHYFAGLVKDEVHRALFFFPIHLPRQRAADRDNFSRAWEYALEHGLVGELSDMARGMVYLSIAQGIKPTSIPTQAIQSLRHHGLPDTNRAMLHLQLIELSARHGIDDIDQVRDLFLAFVPHVEEFGDPELCFWTYERISNIYADLRDLEAIAWNNKAYQAALEMEDEIHTRMAEVLRLWARVVLLGRQDTLATDRLKELLAYFEISFPDSFIVYGILWALAAYLSVSGAYEEAVHYGKRSLSISKRWHDLYWISAADDGLANTYLQMGLSHEAGLQQLDALEWHLAIGQMWQTIGLLFTRAIFYPQLVGGGKTAVAILSVVYHHSEVLPHYKAMIEKVRSQFKAELGADAYAAAWENGKELDFDTTVSLMRAAFSSGRE